MTNWSNRGSEPGNANSQTTPICAASFSRRDGSAVEAGRNRPGGFWCCQADPVAARHAIAGRRERIELRGAALVTDGAARGLRLLPGLHTLERVTTHAVNGAHGSLLGELRVAERIAKPRLDAQAVKAYGDATLVSLLIP